MNTTRHGTGVPASETTTTSADRAGTSPGALARPWPVLSRGDQGQLVKAASELLQSYGYLPEQGLGNVFFDEAMAETVAAYQKAHDLPVNSTLDAETWNQVRDDFGTVGRGERDADKVGAVQVLLSHNGHQVEVDGLFGERTEGAVVAFQRKTNGLVVDGVVGLITFRALVTGGV
ncbi:peptidoglycan-binding domain-containing protein [Nocardiopsis quinghaiensis]|uniref:peptidoglycan-binding domain-containing protein n=1 Tax=Nocardiopsis quinghaiensis TaxID=464995 RepID=UPI001CC2439F|nr:peptidoglycan-binding protein [Nocardiopsis quinghaiensis]